ncbi:IclR family transcriptional regulator [Aureimonas endophytica]|uniref:IclR family transcriptional regulator n=1 Tax=Aureimonas endophytica TaxID=2027858 RepID=A0A917E2N9_9HYPH|nr:IclR family transcriptional regulator [Aureimonas endophytica]GGD99143.1 IclR family transcriptional regulator [Aureimonas endophytica]
MDKPVDEVANRRARGLERAFDILDCLRDARRPMRPNEIATALGAPRSTVYELVGLLTRLDILEPNGGEGRVFLGRRLFLFGQAYADRSDIMREAAAVLDRIVEDVRETAQFCLLDGDKYTVAMMRESSRPFRISSSVGERTPIPWTASGRLLLDHLSDAEILAFVPAEDFRLPSGEWLAPETFLAEVRQATRDGFFTFDSIVDSYTHCFAVPVRRPDGVASATLCLVAPKADAKANHRAYVDCLLANAERLGVWYADAGPATPARSPA